MTVERFLRIVSTVFDKFEKVHKWLFLGQFRLFLESQPYDIDLIAHIGPPHSVKWLEKVSFESLRQFLKNFQKVHKWLFLGQFRLFFETQPYDNDLIAHIGPPHSVKWLEKVSFESLRQFLKNFQKIHKWLFLGQFRLFLETQLYDVDLIAQIGPP